MSRPTLPTWFALLLILAGILVFVPCARADDVEVVVPITINEVPQGETTILLGSDDVFVPVRALERASVSGELWHRTLLVAGVVRSGRQIQGEQAISLKALAPMVSYVFNEANLTLAITVNGRLMATQSMAMSSARPPDIIYSQNPSAFFNYALTGTRSNVGAFGEAAVNVRRNLLYSSFSRSSDVGFVRGITNISHDDSTNLRRYVVGDNTVFSDELGGAGFLAGVTVQKQFDIDPYFVRYPALTLRGIATTPSEVDIYVNGVLVSRQQVAPGPFEVQNVPATAGPSTAQVVVRDVFGREQSQSSSFYYSTSVLGRGISDYLYSAGTLRSNIDTDSFDYGPAVLVASHRRGVTDRLTLGGRLEATRNVVSGGPTLAYASPVGELEFKLAGSSAKSALRGSAAQFGIRKLSRRTNFSAAVRLFSRDYANFSMSPAKDRPLRETVLTASYLPSWGNIGLQWAANRMRDSADTNRLSLIASAPVARTADLMLTVSHVLDFGGGHHNEFSFGVSFHAGPSTTASISALGSADTRTTSATIQKTLPVGTGWGYQVQAASTSGQTDGLAGVEYQNGFGRYEVDTPLRHGSPTGNIAGGVVYEAGRVMATRAVAQSFAVVRVPGIAGVRVYLSNQLIGRTDAHGDLLVPTMLSYYGNRVRIDDRDIPMNYDVQVVEKTIAPPNRGGAYVEFSVRRVRNVTGAVSIGPTDTPASAAFGQLTLNRDDREFVSPLGSGGEFYFENLASGSYNALVEYGKGSCTFSLTVPESDNAAIDLGRISCKGITKP